MNIIKITSKNYDFVDNADYIQYCGRYKDFLGLGNPWEYKTHALYAHYRTETKKEALQQYRKWINAMTELYLTKNQFSYALNQRYMQRVIHLSKKISFGQITALAAYEVDINDYQPVPDGDEQCHTEILYKACLRVIKNG